MQLGLVDIRESNNPTGWPPPSDVCWFKNHEITDNPHEYYSYIYHKP